jgi:osmotically-inducible protein OsmY
VLPESNYRDDAKLTAANNALAANVTVPDSVEAIAEDGNVTLTGMVSYGTERAAAAEAVAGPDGCAGMAPANRCPACTPSGHHFLTYPRS